jgi:hypothetical protein
MTPDALRHLLADLPGAWPPTTDPVALLRALEDRADADPGHRPLAHAVELAHALAMADQQLPLIIAAVRRSHLVRWDTWTTTWIGSDVASGVRTMARVLRPSFSRDPVVRRALRRDARALGAIDTELRWVEHPLPALRRPMPGATLTADFADGGSPSALVRLLMTGLASLGRWERAVIPTPGLAPEEWVVVDGNLCVACLTPGKTATTAHDELRTLAHGLRLHGSNTATTPVDEVIDGLLTFPPETVEEAGILVRKALAQYLTGLRHRLEREHRVVAVNTHHGTLSSLLSRLHHATPPPRGVGAVGVDLDGNVRVVQSNGETVSWGSYGRDLVDIRDADGTLFPIEARRLLRTRAAAPPNPRLSAKVSGSDEFTEAICRWVASAHHLRTMRLLVDKSRP